MRERLLGYLFDQLGPAERREVEEALAHDADLRKELDCLRRCLGEDAQLGEYDRADSCPEDQNQEFLTKSHEGVTNPPSDGIKDSPPEGLAERTCQHVAVTTWSAGSLAPADFSDSGRGKEGQRWRLADAAVGIGIALAAAALLLPAMQQSRYTARRVACQNNLRYLGQAMLQYAELHNGRIPQVPAYGKDAAGGIVPVKLADAGILDRRQLPSMLVCPSSRLAERLRERGISIHVPTREELLAAEGKRLIIIRHMMGGSYAFPVGYMANGKYCVVRIRQSGRVPLIADAPSLHRVDFQSSNHGGCGQNVLFDDGRVVYLKHCTATDCNDKIFVNHQGYRAAGLAPNDAVLVPSAVGPAIEIVSGDE